MILEVTNMKSQEYFFPISGIYSAVYIQHIFSAKENSRNTENFSKIS